VPSGQLGSIAMTAWMDEGDSFIPIMNIPRYYRLVKTAGITLSCKGGSGKYGLGGQLYQLIDGKPSTPLSNRKIRLVIAGKESEKKEIELTTNSQGSFSHSFTTPKENDIFFAVADFHGSTEFAPVHSKLCECKQHVEKPMEEKPSAKPVAQLKDIHIFQARGRYFLRVELTAPAPKNGITLYPKSSNTSLMKMGEVVIPAGKTGISTPVAVSSKYTGQAVHFKVEYHRIIKTASTGKKVIRRE